MPACRFCGATLAHTFVDLGMSPPSNSFLTAGQLDDDERFYPLHARVCSDCKLVQLEEFESPEDIFSDYLYFSSYSQSWLDHARRYTQMVVERFNINSNKQVIEIASNDGYLLQYFMHQGIPVLGIEPAANVARVAIEKGIDTRVMFFGAQTAAALQVQGIRGDLIIGNNVLAHVPDLNDFVAGLKIALAENGAITMEFPHLLRLIEDRQFDTIYHEHFSYFSLLTAEQVFARHGLKVFDVEQLPTHGGSLRVFVMHDNDRRAGTSDRVVALREQEHQAGLNEMAVYLGFADRVRECKTKLLEFLADIKSAGKAVVAYGAAAKGNTLLNYCGVGTQFIDYVVDSNPHKQGTFLPGTHIPVFAPDRIGQTQPDYILLLPWNLQAELSEQLAYSREWGCQLLIPIPTVKLV